VNPETAQLGEAPRRPGRRRRGPRRSTLGDVSVPRCRLDVPSCQLREGLEDLLNRQPTFQIGHHGCHGDAGAGKDRLVAEDLAVLLDAAGVAATPRRLGGLADPGTELVERQRASVVGQADAGTTADSSDRKPSTPGARCTTNHAAVPAPEPDSDSPRPPQPHSQLHKPAPWRPSPASVPLLLEAEGLSSMAAAGRCAPL
jgi:hypothetical protein